MHARLRLERAAENQIKIWVDYIFTLKYTERIPFDPKKPFWQEGIPEGALIFPIIEDTRYHFDELTEMPTFYKELRKTPLIFELNNGILNKEWFKAVEEALEQTPLYFNTYHLEAFLTHFLSTTFNKKVGYQKATQYTKFDKSSSHFYKNILSPQKTMIEGFVKNPVSNTIRLNYTNYESWSKRPWGGIDTELDSNGRFHFEIDLKEPNNLTLATSFFPIPLYAEPGDSIKIEIDGNSIYRRTKFLGSNAVNNQVLLDFYHQIRGDTIMSGRDFSVSQKSQAVYLAKIQQKEARELTFLESQKDRITVNFYLFLDRTIRFSNATKLWGDAETFKNQRDLHLISDYKTYAQKLSQLLFRLPVSKEHDFAIESYLDFQKELLKGTFLKQRLPFRNLQSFAFAKGLLTRDNAFRYGQLLLFFNQVYNSTKSFNQVYKNLDVACSQVDQQEALKEYLLPLMTTDSMALQRNMFRALEVGKNAPSWKYSILSDTDTISLLDFKDNFLLIHVGLEKNLKVAKTDIQEIIANAKGDKKLQVIHLVTRQADTLKESTKEVVYLTDKQMESLRKDYLIENNANNYFIIDPDGKVLSNPFFTGTFNHLKATVADLPLAKKTWQPTPIFWRNLGISALALLFLGGVYAQRKRILAKREQQKRQLVELELKGIRAQMNPHFLFNALSSIQNLIRKKEDIAADRYLTQFAGLVRKILRNSEQEFITLEEEMAAIKQYCSLEALRTPFDYELNISEDVDAFNTYIPGMLIQPLVENAILHGLMPKQGARNLWINIKPHPKGLACEIVDNGIGLQKAQAQKQRHKAHQKSFGMALIRQRLALLLNQPAATFLTMQDQSELTPPTTGTIVNLIIPIEQ